MMSNKNKKIALMGGFAFVTMTMFFNCSKHGFEAIKEDVSSLSDDKGHVEFPFGLLTSEQILKTMLSVTGVSSADTDSVEDVAIRTTYNQRAGSLPIERELDNVTAPMLVSVTNIAGSVCTKLVKEEMARAPSERLFFNEVDFTKAPSQLNAEMVNSISSRMARSFWSREVLPQELSLISNFMLGEYMSGTTMVVDQTRLFGVALCTALVSSFDTLVY